MPNYKPVDDAAIEKLYNLVVGRSQPSKAVREAMETQRLKSVVIHEIGSFKEEARLVQLAKAAGIPIAETTKATTDSQLLKLYRACA